MHRPSYLFLFLIAALALQVQAEQQVYKSVDSEGVVEFSDKPGTNSEPVDVPPPTTFTPVVPATKTKTTTKKSQKPTIRYQEVSIVSPQNDEAVRANDGNIIIHIASQPALLGAAGDRYTIMIDGQRAALQTETELPQNNMNRGTHELLVYIVDRNGVRVSPEARSVFHVLRATVATPRKQRKAGAN